MEILRVILIGKIQESYAFSPKCLVNLLLILNSFTNQWGHAA